MARLLDAAVARDAFAGVVLVARGEQLIYAAGHGLADRARGIPHTRHTPALLASLTKPLTATLVLELVETGSIALDAPIARYRPSFANGGTASRVTVEQLLHHVSGLPGTFRPSGLVAEPHTGAGADVDETGASAPVFPPGSQFKYSSAGYAVLGAIVESVTGSPYERALSQHVLTPLEMRETALGKPDGPYGLGYARGDDGFVPTDDYEIAGAYAAGGLVSTVDDVRRWHDGLFAGRLLAPKTLERMLTPGLGDYGLGVTVHRDGDRRVIEHAGALPGHRTQFRRVEQSGRAPLLIVLLANLGDAPVGDLADGLEALANGERVWLPSERVANVLPHNYRSRTW